LGKTKAMNHGVQNSTHPNILFLDADLKGLKVKHIEKIVGAYREDQKMVIGVFHKGELHTDFSQKFFSWFLSGQRILPKDFWNKLEIENIESYGAEIALLPLAFKEGVSIRKVKLEGLSHTLKEQKRGPQKGICDRFKMYFDIVKSFFRTIKTLLKSLFLK